MQLRFFFLILILTWIAVPPHARAISKEKRCRESFAEIWPYLKYTKTIYSFYGALKNSSKAGEIWPTDGYKPGEYNELFSRVLEGRTIERLALERKERGQSTDLADFFGSAVFTNQPEIFDTLTGIRLNPLKSQWVPSSYDRPHWNEVTGNIYFHSIWKKLDRDMAERKISSFAIIMFRPVGPLFEHVGRFVLKGSRREKATFFNMNYRVLNEAWKRLTFDDGEMLIQLTHIIMDNPIFNAWLDQITLANIPYEKFKGGLNASAIRLRKTKDSSAILPTVPETILNSN